uniref:CC domain-containing protein n=1 Tax=Setaria digitata TaxID=48799 RepID=A0A915PN69_9BILA
MNQTEAILVISFPVAMLFLVLTTISTNGVIMNDQNTSPNTNISFLKRFKRQYSMSCPGSCFPSCYTSSQCHQISPRMICIQSCCCPATLPTNSHSIFSPGSINIIPIPVPIGSIGQRNVFSLSTACDGGPAVAACINGLCGQGFFCNSRGFCCRCATGNSTGPCINNLCPAGYSCNTNYYCCPLGSGSVLGPCINNQCPTGYTCGAGNLCYSVATSGFRIRK